MVLENSEQNKQDIGENTFVDSKILLDSDDDLDDSEEVVQKKGKRLSRYERNSVIPLRFRFLDMHLNDSKDHYIKYKIISWDDISSIVDSFNEWNSRIKNNLYKKIDATNIVDNKSEPITKITIGDIIYIKTRTVWGETFRENIDIF